MKLTAAQRRVLQNLVEGNSPTEGLSGRSAFGGYFRTRWSLVRAGLVERHADRITDAGRAALAGTQ
jgi:hypothetical protein